MSTLYIIASELYSMLPWRTVAIRDDKGAYGPDILISAGFIRISNNGLHILKQKMRAYIPLALAGLVAYTLLGHVDALVLQVGDFRAEWTLET